jgi:hypothetical protein
MELISISVFLQRAILFAFHHALADFACATCSELFDLTAFGELSANSSVC